MPAILLKPELKTQFVTGIINEPVYTVLTFLECRNGMQLPAWCGNFSLMTDYYR
jgi:hypothetical protein